MPSAAPSDSLVTLSQPDSAFAEAFRRLRTNVQFADVDRPLRTLAVAASQAGGGKSTTAANLAVAFAQAGKQVALVDADGTWLAIAVVPASTQERDTLPALDAGKAEWPSLREVILDGAFTAERCREWSNLHGMRHRVVEREPEQKSFVVLQGRWVVERSFGWLVHWGGLLRDRAGRLDVSAARLAFAAVLSGVEALLNPMPVHADVS